MKKRMLILALCGALALCAACAPAQPEETGSAVTLPAPGTEAEQAAAQAAQQVLGLLLAGDYEAVLANGDEALREALTAGQLAAAWDAYGAPLGGLSHILDTGAQEQEGVIAVQLLTQQEHGQLLLTCSFDEAMRLCGLYLKTVSDTGAPQPIALPLPEGAVERAVTLHAGTQMALAGAVVFPAGYGPDTPAVVFAHGSGSSDMDETLYANKPFRDIAYGLAERGVASIRYDKLSYAHPELFSATDMTVDLEYTGTVLEALRVLRETAALGPVYLAGHSLGGMLTPYLMQQSEGGFAGGVILAGSPRKLWQISLSQNEAILATLPEAQQAENRALLEAEAEKARRLLSMTEAEARGATVFGMPAYYLRRLEEIDALALARANALPLLILQGEADFQVSMQEDFAAWQAGLADLEGLVTLRSYPGLNHLFMPARGDIQDLAAAYGTPDTVDASVIAEIADWILQLPKTQ